MEPVKSKFCVRCGEAKSASEFHRDKQKSDGLRSYCRLCDSKQQAARYANFTEEQKAARRERAKNWRSENPTASRAATARYRLRNIDKKLLSSRRFRMTNPGYARQHRLRNIERYRQNERAWRQRNPVAARINSAAYKARRKAAGGSHSVNDIATLMHAQRSRCAVCRRSLKQGFHIDHVRAISRGGSNDRLNLQLLCGPCNQSKGSRPFLSFMRSRGFLL